MNKYFKYFFMLIATLFLFTMRIYALNKTCDYSATLNGKEFKYRVVVNVDDNLLTDTSKRDAKGNSYWNNHIERYYYNVEKGKYDSIGNIVCSKSDKYNIVDGKVCVLDTAADKKDFFAMGLSGSSFNCPAMYQYNPSIKNKENVTFIANKEKASSTSTSANNTGEEVPNIGIYQGEMDCADILGENLTKVVHLAIKIIRIAGAIITILQATLTLVPAVTSGDADALKKAGKKCVTLAIILAAIGLFPTILHVIGNICGFDLSCIA